MNRIKRWLQLYRLYRLTRMHTLDLYEEKLRIEDRLLEVQIIIQGRSTIYDAPIEVKEAALWRDHDNHDLPPVDSFQTVGKI